MCVVSYMGDHYTDRWKDLAPFLKPDSPYTNPVIPNQQPYIPDPKKTDELILSKLFQREVTRQEFDDLKKEVEEMKKILTLAAEYDKRNNEPHCEMEQKVDLLKKMAGLFGISLDDVFGKPKEEKII